MRKQLGYIWCWEEGISTTSFSFFFPRNLTMFSLKWIELVRNNNNSNNNNQDTRDPYYVHPSKNPTTVCVTPLNSGDNYHDWALKMDRALATKNKFKCGWFDSNSKRGWSQFFCGRDATIWCILGSWTQRLRQLQKAWCSLRTRSMCRTISRIGMWGNQINIARLQHDIVNLKQGNRTITEYFT
jgi:hypothetical protein